jgi:hypothetical protein
MKKNYRMTLIAVISAVVIGLGIMFFKLYIQLNQPVDFNQSLEEGISDEVLYESLPSVRKNLPRKTTETESLTDVTFDGKILTNKVMTEIDERVFKQKIDEVSMF